MFPPSPLRGFRLRAKRYGGQVGAASPLVCFIALLLATAIAGPSAAQQTRRFLYVAVPGAGNEVEYRGVGILVYDIDKGHAFVKRIPTWSVAAGQEPEYVRGIAASASSRRLYVS